MTTLPHRPRSPRRARWRLALLAAGLATSANGWCALNLDALTALGPEQLAELRGGFLGPGGAQIAFSFEHLVKIDGDLEAHVAVQLPLTGLHGSGAELAQRMRDSIRTIQQVGDQGSTISTGLHTIIQNQWDNRAIESLRVLDVDLRGIERLGTVGLSHQLQPYLVQSLR